MSLLCFRALVLLGPLLSKEGLRALGFQDIRSDSLDIRNILICVSEGLMGLERSCE